MRSRRCTIDSSCIIALDHLQLVPQPSILFSPVLVPKAVRNELLKRRAVLVLPEDDANRGLANSFLLDLDFAVLSRIQILPEVGGWKGGSMRKAKSVTADELRSEYKRSDFGAVVRGKYSEQLRAKSNVVVIAPEVADLFPNASAVNAALRSLAEIAKRAGSRRGRSR
jgi:hypothetical protein